MLISIVGVTTQPAIPAAWVWISWCLSITGMAGGLAYHLLENGGELRLPSFSFKTWPVVNLGFIAELIIGAVAANSIHLAVSGIASYDDTVVNQPKFILTMISLGVLAGFGGATILRSLSEKLQRSLIDRQLKALTGDVRETQDMTRQLANAHVTKTILAVLEFSREATAADNNIIEMRAKEIDTGPAAGRSAEDWLLHGYWLFTHGKYTKAINSLKRQSKSSSIPNFNGRHLT